jgi:protein Mpv17
LCIARSLSLSLLKKGGVTGESVPFHQVLDLHLSHAILFSTLTHIHTHTYIQEIAMRIPMDTWAGYETALEDKPVATKTMINVVIYLLGDWLSQTVFQKRNVLDFDAKRTLRNGFIGLCFGPLVHAYYEFSDTILPLTDGDLWTRGEKILMDQTIYLAVKCSIYVAAVSMLQGDSFDTAKDNVKNRLPNIVVTAWKFWPLVHCLTYSVIPSRHRILWVNMIDLIWNAILASMASKKLPSPDETVALAQEEAAATALTMIEGESSSSSSSSSPLPEGMVVMNDKEQQEQQQLDDILVLASLHDDEEQPAALDDSSLIMEQTQSEQLLNNKEENIVLVQVVSSQDETRTPLSMGPTSGNATMAVA